MARNWNVTGLYKRQRDRMPTRGRKIAASPSASRLVPIEPAPICEHCGFALDTNAHRMFCATQDGTPEERDLRVDQHT